MSYRGPKAKYLFFEAVRLARANGYELLSLYPASGPGGHGTVGAFMNRTIDGHRVSNFRVVFERNPADRDSIRVEPDTCIGAESLRDCASMMEQIERLFGGDS